MMIKSKVTKQMEQVIVIVSTHASTHVRMDTCVVFSRHFL